MLLVDREVAGPWNFDALSNPAALFTVGNKNVFNAEEAAVDMGFGLEFIPDENRHRKERRRSISSPSLVHITR